MKNSARFLPQNPVRRTRSEKSKLKKGQHPFWLAFVAVGRAAHRSRVKAFVYTGSVLFLSLALIVSANYAVLAKKNQEAGVIEKLRIDKTFNRYVDTLRIINAAVNDGVAEGITCVAKADLIDTYLRSALGSPLLDANGLTLSYTASVTPNCFFPPPIQILVSVSFTIEDAAQTVHKEGAFSATIPA